MASQVVPGVEVANFEGFLRVRLVAASEGTAQICVELVDRADGKAILQWGQSLLNGQDFNLPGVSITATAATV